MLNQPLVTVIIPVYNGQRYLGQALDSVFAQSYGPREVIVVDDGSTDDSAAIARAYPSVHYLYQQNQGPGAARNRALAVAQGELIAFLDQDDTWHLEKLRVQVDYLEQHRQIEAVIAHMQIVLEMGTPWPATLNRDHYRSEPPCYMPSALLTRRTLFAQIGLFNPAYSCSSDSDWFFRVKDAGIPLAVIPQVLLTKRIHPTNQFRDQTIVHQTLQAVRSSIHRRRQAGEKQSETNKEGVAQ
jgi:glycosyltransferase involved in cell wall biosynthesis